MSAAHDHKQQNTRHGHRHGDPQECAPPTRAERTAFFRPRDRWLEWLKKNWRPRLRVIALTKIETVVEKRKAPAASSAPGTGFVDRAKQGRARPTKFLPTRARSSRYEDGVQLAKQREAISHATS